MRIIDWLEEEIWWPIERVLNKIRQFPREVKWRWQRSKKGYAECDLWSLDSYLLDLLINSIQEFRDYDRVGVPSQYTYKKDDKDLSKGTARYNKDLDYILENLRIYNDIAMEYEFEKYGGMDKAWPIGQVAFKKAMYKLTAIFRTLWD